MKPNTCTDLKIRDRIKVKAQPVTTGDKVFAGMTGTFIRYGRTGYAIVTLDEFKGQYSTMIHPENLEVIL